MLVRLDFSWNTKVYRYSWQYAPKNAWYTWSSVKQLRLKIIRGVVDHTSHRTNSDGWVYDNLEFPWQNSECNFCVAWRVVGFRWPRIAGSCCSRKHMLSSYEYENCAPDRPGISSSWWPDTEYKFTLRRPHMQRRIMPLPKAVITHGDLANRCQCTKSHTAII